VPTKEESIANMDAAFGLVTFSVFFFVFMLVLGIVRARHSKEKAYYLSGLVAGLMLFTMVSILLSQFVLFAVFFFTAFIVSLASMSKVTNAFEKEATTQRQETNVFESIKA
jgi:predicted membrane protein